MKISFYREYVYICIIRVKGNKVKKELKKRAIHNWKICEKILASGTRVCVYTD